MKKTGIILELNKKKATVITDELEFAAIKRAPGMFIGQQVDVYGRLSQFNLICIRAGKYCLPVLAAFAIFIIIYLFSVNYHRQADLLAYVSLDINPSLELAVNKKTRIMYIRDLNKDATILLRKSNFTNLPLHKALLVLVDKAEEMHYLEKGRFILISAAVNGVSIKEMKLIQTINKLKDELTKRDIHLEFIKTTLEQRKLALRNHLSVGRYVLLTSANHIGKSMELSEAKTGSIASLIDKSGVLEKANPDKKIQTSRDNQKTSRGKVFPNQADAQIKELKQDDNLKNRNGENLRTKETIGGNNDNNSNHLTPGGNSIKNSTAPEKKSLDCNSNHNDVVAGNDPDNDDTNGHKENSTVSDSADSEKTNHENCSGSSNAGSVIYSNNSKSNSKASQPKK